jgi:hypothetical protein
VWAAPLLPIAVLTLGYPDRARLLMKEALARAERCVDAFWAGHVHMWAGIFSAMLHDAQAALEHSQVLGRMAAKQPVWSGLADFYAGKALMIQGRWEEGAGYLRKAIAFHNSVGLFGLLRWLKLDEADLFASQGQIDEALALAATAIADPELPHLRSPALRQRAELLAKSNTDASTIDAAYRAAIECARSQGARYYELQAATSFSRWLKSQQRAAEARTLLAEIYGWFTEGFDTPVLNDAKALLDELSSRPSASRRSNKSRKDDSGEELS